MSKTQHLPTHQLLVSSPLFLAAWVPCPILNARDSDIARIFPFSLVKTSLSQLFVIGTPSYQLLVLHTINWPLETASPPTNLSSSIPLCSWILWFWFCYCWLSVIELSWGLPNLGPTCLCWMQPLFSFPPHYCSAPGGSSLAPTTSTPEHSAKGTTYVHSIEGMLMTRKVTPSTEMLL